VSEKFQVATLSEIEIPSADPAIRWAPIRRHLDVGSFGINAWTAAEAGTNVIGEHDEVGPRAQRHEELYFVAEGRATFTVDDETIDAPAGHGRLRSRPVGKASGRRRGGRDDGADRRRSAGRGIHTLDVGALGARTGLLRDSGVREGAASAAEGARGVPG
jgi:hypothetical protein